MRVAFAYRQKCFVLSHARERLSEKNKKKLPERQVEMKGRINDITMHFPFIILVLFRFFF